MTVDDGVMKKMESGNNEKLEVSDTLISEVTPSSHHATATSKRFAAKTGTNDGDGQRKVKRLRKRIRTNDVHPLVKYGSLVLLITQMVGLVLLMRYSRTQKESEEMYLASTAVFSMEFMKFVICNGMVFVQAGSKLSSYMKEITDHIWNSPMEVLKLCVPSLLYTIQNNLLYLALSNLDAATYQVCYQSKILTTAIFSMIMLDRKFSPLKWLSLFILALGVSIVQISGSTEKAENEEDSSSNNRIIGLMAVFCAAVTSGFSGVYFEKILKGSMTSIWIRNIQMGLPSVILAYATVFVHDSASVREKGFFVGYTSVVWTVVTVQAVGGLIVALVVKYADNVLKVFATSISIVISCIISAIFFDFHPTLSFLFGTTLVMISTVMYSKPERKVRRRLKKSVLPVTNPSIKKGNYVM